MAEKLLAFFMGQISTRIFFHRGGAGNTEGRVKERSLWEDNWED
jgi:hypothetical protein